MIKKILIAFLIVIMVIVISIVSLVVFVDPNNFKGFISEKVKDKTGYELTIEGDLKWHIWPQVSILTDNIKLTDPGASKPIVSADNMRLDVELIPLLSKDIAIKNVLINSAVITITDESKGNIANEKNTQTTTINQNGTVHSSSQSTPAPQNKRWSFALDKLEVTNSTIVLQNNADFINFRNIDLLITHKDSNAVSVDLSGNIERNQKELSYRLKADVNLEQFPQNVNIALKKFDYTYKGVGIPTDELNGTLTATINYQRSPLVLDSRNVMLSINDNQLYGTIKIDAAKKTYIEGVLNADKLDLTPFLATTPKQDDTIAIQQTSPVITKIKITKNELDFLNSVNANLKLNAKEVKVNKLTLNNLIFNVINQDGVATFNNVNFDLNDGHVKLDGIADGKQKTTKVKLATTMTAINLNSLFKDLEIKNDITGELSAQGDISTDTLISSDLLAALQGKLSISVSKARLENINIPSIIQSSVAKFTKDVSVSENRPNYTELHELSAMANLHDGNMELTSLKANSDILDINGSGRIGMVNRDLDVDLNIRLFGGWQGKSNTIAKLQKMVVPLKIYGEFSKLHYKIEIDDLLKDFLSDKLQHGLDKLRDRLQRNRSNNDSKDESLKRAEDILGGLIK